MVWQVDGNLVIVAIQGELEALISLEQMLQISSSQWHVYACELTPSKTAEASSGLLY